MAFARQHMSILVTVAMTISEMVNIYAPKTVIDIHIVGVPPIEKKRRVTLCSRI